MADSNQNIDQIQNQLLEQLNSSVGNQIIQAITQSEKQILDELKLSATPVLEELSSQSSLDISTLLRDLEHCQSLEELRTFAEQVKNNEAINSKYLDWFKDLVETLLGLKLEPLRGKVGGRG